MSYVLEHLKDLKLSLEKDRKEYSDIVYGNFLGRICELRMMIPEITKKYGDDYKTLLEIIRPLAAEEKECFRMANLQKKSAEYIEKIVQLDAQIAELSIDISRKERGLS
jgi:hypothetical protein